MRQLFLVTCIALAWVHVIGCSEEASSGPSVSSDTTPPPIRSDPQIKAPLDWKLERDVVAALAWMPHDDR
jgi:hypothetical protein